MVVAVCTWLDGAGTVSYLGSPKRVSMTIAALIFVLVQAHFPAPLPRAHFPFSPPDSGLRSPESTRVFWVKLALAASYLQ